MRSGEGGEGSSFMDVSHARAHERSIWNNYPHPPPMQIRAARLVS